MSDTKHGEFGFIAGHPALDFVNTASGREGGDFVERLGSYDDLLSWARKAGMIDQARSDELASVAAERPRAAAAALERARELREAAFRLFACLIERREPDASDLALLNRRAVQSVRGGAVRWKGGRFAVDEPPARSPLEEPLCRAARGIVEVLCGEASGSVSRCADRECSWLFIDRSPSHARRWCSMADCGNRAKVRRHYQKRKDLERRERERERRKTKARRT